MYPKTKKTSIFNSHLYITIYIVAKSQQKIMITQVYHLCL